MASIAFPQYSKHLSLSTTHTYNYVYIPTNKAPLPTILFLHGFPSSSYDWRHQISFFAAHGYGVLAPDLLGYGGTSKPAAVEGYKTKKMAAEIAEILDHENLTRVHAVAHDTGCILLSRLVNYFPQKIHSCTFLAVPYSRPGEHFDLDAVNAMTKQILGHEQFGYLKLFVSDGSDYLLDEHSESFSTLFYPAEPDLWEAHVGPTGAMESWLRADYRAPLAPYITDEERTIHQKIMKGHHSSALNWYRALVWNVNEKDEVEDALPAKLSLPVMMVTAAPSSVQLPGAAEQMKAIADDLVAKEVSTRGHWMQLEARDEVNSILKDFFEKMVSSTSV